MAKLWLSHVLDVHHTEMVKNVFKNNAYMGSKYDDADLVLPWFNYCQPFDVTRKSILPGHSSVFASDFTPWLFCLDCEIKLAL